MIQTDIWQLLQIYVGIFKNKKDYNYNSFCERNWKFFYFPTAETQTDVAFMMHKCI